MSRDLWLAITQKAERYDRCDTCGDSWHGLPCRRVGCNCPTSFVDKDGAA
jgi:hypothetical protein